VRSGFVSLVGRPNAGKSTLLNAFVGTKVSIVSDKPQTTRTQVRAVVDRPATPDQEEAQLVFVDTPGIHKPVTALGERLNATARESMSDIDVVCLLLDATQPFGRGDRFVADRLEPARTVVVVNKVDRASRQQVLRQLDAAAELAASAYFPVSAARGDGVPALLDHLFSRLPEGPRYFPEGMVTDVPEAFWVAELVREQLLAVTHHELPYSIAARVTEWEWPRIRVEIVVERDSQKGMVIGKGGAVLKAVGTAVRAQLPEGAFVELFVTLDKDWQRRPDRITRLGY
jgi:GTPase